MRKFVCLVLVSFALCACVKKVQRDYQEHIINFGTVIDITVNDTNERAADAAFAEIKQQLKIMNQRWHAWHKGMLFNANEKLAKLEPVTVDQEFINLVQHATILYDKSSGLFNPAAGKFSEVWGFLNDDPLRDRSAATQLAINKLMQHPPSMHDISIQHHVMTTSNSNVKLDVGGYAKGIAINSLITILKKHGIDNALINIGGDIKVIGQHGNKPWKIGIRHPINPDEALATIELEPNQSIMTSGTYVRYFKDHNNKAYHHIIDPRTGAPAQGFVATTVVAEDPILSDAAATSLLIAGPSMWSEIAANMDIENFILIDENKNLIINQKLYAKLQDLNIQDYKLIIK